MLFSVSRRRIPVVRQMSATDCGAAALAMVLGFHGRTVPLREIRDHLKPGRNGSTLAALTQAAAIYGLRGQPVTMDLDALASLDAGTILHWEFRHFVVFSRLRPGTVEIVDPAAGYRLVPMESFRQAFTGAGLVFELTERFEKGTVKSTHLQRAVVQLAAHWRLITRILTVAVLIQLLSAVLPLLTGLLIDRVVPRKDYSLLLLLTTAYTACQLFSALAGFVRDYLSTDLRTRLESVLTLSFLDHLVNLPYSFFQQRTSGDLMVRLNANSAVREIITSTLMSTVLDGTIAMAYLVLLMLVSVRLTVVVFIVASARLVLLAVSRWRQRRLLLESMDNQARFQTSQVELLSGMETLKAMGVEPRAAERCAQVFIEGLNLSVKRSQLEAVFNGALNLLGTTTTLALLFYGAYVVLAGQWTLGNMMAFNALAGGLLGPLNRLVSAGLQMQMLEIYLERLNDVLDTAPEDTAPTIHVSRRLTGAIELRHVSFRYGTFDPLVLDDVCLDIVAGSRLALVGRTGSGKSTLARLLALLYQPEAGSVLFDGQESRTLNRRSVRRQLGFVTQDTQLFGGSIRSNIALSNPDLSLERVIEAARLACIHDEIDAMPMGYDTPLVDRGLSLSGGQRQRIAIARALAGEPRVVVLDEATSHLDEATERLVNHNLATLRCTRIVIAHRLSTIATADTIVVMDSGRIVERGAHDELLANRRAYHGLVGAQRLRHDARYSAGQGS
jgi:ATP-binding cassette subfamily B protein